MSDCRVRFVCAVLIYSPDAARLAAFYRRTLGIPLVDEQHGDEPLHYGCELGDTHFAIHPLPAGEHAPASARIKLAFETRDMAAMLARLPGTDAEVVQEPEHIPEMGLLAAIRDPDGNLIELTQFDEVWYRHLEQLRAERDVLARDD